MLTDTSVLIEEVIMRLESLREILADDASVCRRAGLKVNERDCAEALSGIAVLLPRLERARISQDVTYALPGRQCLHCDD